METFLGQDRDKSRIAVLKTRVVLKTPRLWLDFRVVDTGKAEETLHYGEIDFSKLNPKEVSKAEQEKTVYSSVQVSKTENADTQPTEKLDKLYENILPFENMFVHILLNLLLSSGADAACTVPNNLQSTTPSPMEALSGSCLFIPCTINL
ncbi:hypothetical protein WMY93_030021 [Mugilogobius chulae]|uniref:Uncharacterized protein n=1 Tax=Mugilogobius chulae TaxID=88201 RepID=A0AAW0MLG8_9GOBI